MVTNQKKPKADISFESGSATIFCRGTWNLQGISRLKERINNLKVPENKPIIIDGSEITTIDTSGAWQLNQIIKKLQEQGVEIKLQGFTPEQKKLLSLVESQAKQVILPKSAPPENWLTTLGKKSANAYSQFVEYLAFVGEVSIVAVRSFFGPSRVHWPYLFRTLETAGFQALPIIALLSFMIGVVLAYQIGLQLRNYGAHIFIVDLLGGSILREFGPLLTAIMVAGRSGSAFTAQLGTMKLNEEIDALNTMGLAPAQLLVIPRLIGLFIALPLITMWANIFGIIGGMLMSQTMFSIGPYEFLSRFDQQISINSLFIGLGKAPVFALLIASIGCFQGLQVSGGAESVGDRTTKSVVQAIFMIIVADAFFSVIFSRLNL